MSWEKQRRRGPRAVEVSIFASVCSAHNWCRYRLHRGKIDELTPWQSLPRPGWNAHGPADGGRHPPPMSDARLLQQLKTEAESALNGATSTYNRCWREDRTNMIVVYEVDRASNGHRRKRPSATLKRSLKPSLISAEYRWVSYPKPHLDGGGLWCGRRCRGALAGLVVNLNGEPGRIADLSDRGRAVD